MAFARALFSIALCSAVAGSSVFARAAAPGEADADTLITRGIELREQGKDEEALAVFRAAYAKTPTPRARAQVALAQQALGMWVAAETDLIAALAAATDPWIAKNRAALDGALGVIRRHVGTLEIRGADGAEVLVDGVSVGTSAPGASFRVEAGRRTLEIRGQGSHSTTRQVEIPAGGVARETVTLVATSAPPSASRPLSGELPSASSVASGDAGAGQRIVGWAFIGTGGALLATGGVGLLVRKSIVDDYNETCPGIGVTQPAGCDEKVESQRTWQTVSIVSLIAGGVFALTGGALMALAPSAPKRSARVDCSVRALTDGGGAFAGCVGSF